MKSKGKEDDSQYDLMFLKGGPQAADLEDRASIGRLTCNIEKSVIIEELKVFLFKVVLLGAENMELSGPGSINGGEV